MIKDNNKYTREEKERLTARLFPPENCTPSDLSAETGISKSTLATWKAKAIRGNTNNNSIKKSGTMSSREKFLSVLDTYTMSEIELSRYCREKGIYAEDIKKWRISCIDANGSETTDTRELKQELQDDKKKIKACCSIGAEVKFLKNQNFLQHISLTRLTRYGHGISPT